MYQMDWKVHREWHIKMISDLRESKNANRPRAKGEQPTLVLRKRSLAWWPNPIYYTQEKSAYHWHVSLRLFQHWFFMQHCYWRSILIHFRPIFKEIKASCAKEEFSWKPLPKICTVEENALIFEGQNKSSSLTALLKFL